MNKKGTTFILTTHDIGDVESLSHRVIVINHGQIVFDGGIGELKRKTDGRISVSLTVRTPFDRETAVGVAECIYKTDRDADFIIDTEKISIADFITLMNGRYGISDLTVTGQPIEETVKQLYTM
jgi:ABC-2 type transport system ATP-binding protein